MTHPEWLSCILKIHTGTVASPFLHIKAFCSWAPSCPLIGLSATYAPDSFCGMHLTDIEKLDTYSPSKPTCYDANFADHSARSLSCQFCQWAREDPSALMHSRGNTARHCLILKHLLGFLNAQLWNDFSLTEGLLDFYDLTSLEGK